MRVTPLERVTPEMQLFSQLVISAVLLMAVSPFFGPFIRELAPIHWAALAFQTLAIASFGYLFWFFLLKRYPASGGGLVFVPVAGLWCRTGLAVAGRSDRG